VTVVVAVRDRNGNWAIGSDSTTWEGPVAMAPLPPAAVKICRRPDGVIYATCGAAALRVLLGRAIDDVDAGPGGRDDGWAQEVAESWSELGRAHHHVHEGSLDGQAFIAHRDRCWDISDGLALPLAKWHAIGAGHEIATGALAVLQRFELAASDAARRSVEAAITFHRDCDGTPIVYETERHP
jgi:ATP-dependent protease HslVU (ClpYQ) peptidase subunit